MAFSSQQVRKLRSRLKPRHVRLREAEGQTLHYLEGWYVVAEANRIFGFDGWDRETVSNACVWTKQLGSRYCAAYVARVRITVRAGDERIIREGSGAGESSEPSPGQAHDRASKAAETDATKRALTTFGNCFGLTLYAGTPFPGHGRQGPVPARAYGNGSHGLEKAGGIGALSPSRIHDHQRNRKVENEAGEAAGGDADGGDPGKMAAALDEASDESAGSSDDTGAGVRATVRQAASDSEGGACTLHSANGEESEDNTNIGQDEPLGTASNVRTKTVPASGSGGDVRPGIASGNGQPSGNGSLQEGSVSPEHSRTPVAVSSGGHDDSPGDADAATAALQPHDETEFTAPTDQNLPPAITPEEPAASAIAVASLENTVPLVVNSHSPDAVPRRAVDKSMLAIAEPRRVRDPEHLKYVADQPCIICGRQPCEAHHLRYVQPRALGRKSSDAYTVPLCALHHRELHGRGNEHAWWVAKGRDPLPMADQLWRETSRQRRASGDEIFD